MSGRIFGNIIEVRQGDSFDISLKAFCGNKSFDMKTSTVRMQVRDLSGKMMFEIKGRVIGKDLAVLSVTPEQSRIAVGEYECDIQLETQEGSVNTVFPPEVNRVGIFRITRQVTVKENKNV